MKTLSTESAAAALGIERKTLDNVLAREGRMLLAQGSRGRSRRIPVAALERIAIALVLSRDIGVGIAKGLELSERILASPFSPVTVGSLSAVLFDVARLRAALERSIDEALEGVAERTRGRPRL
jgi:hypothetical protein